MQDYYCYNYDILCMARKQLLLSPFLSNHWKIIPT